MSGHVSARELHLFNTEENGAGGVVRLTAPAFQSSLFQREPRGSGPCKLSTDILYKIVSYFFLFSKCSHITFILFTKLFIEKKKKR